MISSILSLFLLNVWAASSSLDKEFASLTSQGYVLSQSVSDQNSQARFTVALFHHPKRDWNKLNVYSVFKGKSFLVYSHPGVNEKIALDPSMSSEQFPDPWKTRGKHIIYRSTIPGLNKTSLHVLRCQGPKVLSLASFAEGELKDLNNDGLSEAIVRTLPLGRFLSVGCESFQTMTQQAFRTRIYSLKKNRWVDVSSKIPSFFDKQINAREEKLSLLPKEKQPGEYLGEAIALFYDYEAKGSAKKGWNRLNTLLEPPPLPIPQISDCILQAKKDLRSQLRIPQNW